MSGAACVRKNMGRMWLIQQARWIRCLIRCGEWFSSQLPFFGLRRQAFTCACASTPVSVRQSAQKGAWHPALAQVSAAQPSYSAKTWRQRGQRSETRSSISLRANMTRRSSSDFAANCSFQASNSPCITMVRRSLSLRRNASNASDVACRAASWKVYVAWHSLDSLAQHLM